jgi:hypothetical protein
MLDIHRQQTAAPDTFNGDFEGEPQIIRGQADQSAP